MAGGDTAVSAGSGAGRALTAPCGNALCAASPVSVRVRLMLQRLGEAEMALS